MPPELPRALVISFQRTGINWLRHCAEHFSGVRTPSRPHMISDGPALFDRTHNVARPNKRSEFKDLYGPDGKEVYERVALLIRNPFDCFISQYTRKGVPFDEGIERFVPMISGAPTRPSSITRISPARRRARSHSCASSV